MEYKNYNKKISNLEIKLNNFLNLISKLDKYNN
jgi:hypothetical protein